MITADIAYALGFATVTVIVGVLATIWYARHGWPRSSITVGLVPVPDAAWRKRVRLAVAALLGLFAIGLAGDLAINGAGTTSPSTATTPMGAWASKYMTPYVKPIVADLSAVKMAASSLVGMNNACSAGVADTKRAVQDPALNAQFQTLYFAWLVDVSEWFTYCQAASSSQAQSQSTVGKADWAEASSLASKIDKLRAKILAYGYTLN